MPRPRTGKKAMVDYEKFDILNPQDARDLLGDGNFGGAWQKPDDLMMEIWRVGVEETRELLAGPWPNQS